MRRGSPIRHTSAGAKAVDIRSYPAMLGMSAIGAKRKYVAFLNGEIYSGNDSRDGDGDAQKLTSFAAVLFCNREKNYATTNRSCC